MLFQLSSQDAQFLYMETKHNLTHVTLVTVYDPSTVPGKKTIRYMDIVRHVQGRLAANPFMTRKLMRVPLELDYPYWIDDEFFDIDCHMRHSRLPDPRDWRQLCIYTARYHSRPLDMNRPPWEMEVVEGLDNVQGLPKGCYAIATKIHHSALDGAAMMKFIAGMADKDNKGTPALPIRNAEFEVGETPTLSTIINRATLNNIRSPIRLFNSVLRATPGLYKAAQSVLQGGNTEKTPVPETRFDQPVSPHKVFDGTYFDLEDLKSVRRAVDGATVNDVVLAICGGGLRKYLEHHDELTEDSLVAWVPINARPGGASDANTDGNNISATTVPIYTQIADPVERLAAVHKATSHKKKASSGGSARLITDLSRHMPAIPQVLTSQLLVRSGIMANQCNLFVSNVPGPAETLYMNGARAAMTFGMVPLSDGLGLFIATPSYAGKIGFLVTSTREILPDIRFFVECLEAALDELKRATVKPKRRRRQKTASK